MFDEMSIRENLLFNQRFDCIEGFEDCGSQGRTCNIANHAYVESGSSQWHSTLLVEALRQR
jgi:hypothetical protein